MPTFRYFTVADALCHLQDFAGSNLKASQLRQRRTAVAAAYQHLTTLRPWRYYVKQDRLTVEAPYSTGTATYDHTGGAAERLLTIAGGTFPSWAGRGTVVIGTGEYEIDAVLTTTTAQLTETSNPGADVGSSSYAIYHDRHLLPIDAVGVDQLFGSVDRKELTWTDPKDFLTHRQKSRETDRPEHYTVLGDVDSMGRLMLRITPFPSEALGLDYTYLRRARPLLFDSYQAGTITTAGTVTVEGTTVSWTDNMDGSILRVSYSTAETDEDNGDSDPQWFEPMALPNPYIYERRIASITDSNTLVVESLIPALTGVRYEISDPIDVEPGAMFTAFLRCCEWQLGCVMRWADRKDLYEQYQLAMQDAATVDEQYNLRRAITPPPVEEVVRRDAMPIQMGGRI